MTWWGVVAAVALLVYMLLLGAFVWMIAEDEHYDELQEQIRGIEQQHRVDPP